MFVLICKCGEATTQLGALETAHYSKSCFKWMKDINYQNLWPNIKINYENNNMYSA